MIEYPDEFTIELSKENLSKGIRYNKYCCPISLALRDKFKGCVANTTINQTMITGENIAWYKHDGAGFITTFDSIPWFYKMFAWFSYISPITVRFHRTKEEG